MTHPKDAAQAAAPDSVSYARGVTRDSASKVPVGVGGLVAGKYLVEQVVGAGGMGVVVVAKHLQLDRKVAIKFLLPHAASNAEAATRFKREARAMAKLHNEHVVRVLDVGTLEQGEPYMVMEYLEGTDISRFVRERGPLPVPVMADYVLQACEAIAEAHARGIVHRDLKPSNIFLARRVDGTYTVKLLDFGIAKLPADSAEAQQSFTTTTALLGSPVYMSPEQLQCSRDADARADIWSLGAIMYKMLVSRPPFLADTMPQVCTLIMSAQPQPLRQIMPDAPPELEAILFKCLEKRPEDRYQSVGELAEALSPFAPPHAQGSMERVKAVIHAMAAGATSVPPGPVSSPSGDSSRSHSLRLQPRPSMSQGSGASLSQPVKTHRVLFALAAGIAVGSAATLWFAFQQHKPESARPAAPPAASVAAPATADLSSTDNRGPEAPSTGAVPVPPPTAAAASTAPETSTARKAQPPAAAPPLRPRPPPTPRPRAGASDDNAEFGGRK